MSDDTSKQEPPATLPGDAEAVLAAALDEIIPPSGDGRMPGAGALGIASAVVAKIGADAEAARLFGAALQRLADAAHAQGAGSFAALAPEHRRETLASVATEAPELFEQLLGHAAAHYYSHPRIIAALGMRAGPPFPRGYVVEPLDESLLDAVRAMPPIYRET